MKRRLNEKLKKNRGYKIKRLESNLKKRLNLMKVEILQKIIPQNKTAVNKVIMIIRNNKTKRVLRKKKFYFKIRNV